MRFEERAVAGEEQCIPATVPCWGQCTATPSPPTLAPGCNEAAPFTGHPTIVDLRRLEVVSKAMEAGPIPALGVDVVDSDAVGRGERVSDATDCCEGEAIWAIMADKGKPLKFRKCLCTGRSESEDTGFPQHAVST